VQKGYEYVEFSRTSSNIVRVRSCGLAKGFELLSLAESMNDPERRADILRYARLWMSLTEPILDLPLSEPYGTYSRLAA
jgi:hypothetical protein